MLKLLLLPGLLTAAASLAQTAPLTIRPPLTSVTVYLDGAALEHRGPVTLAAGLNRVVVSGLSPRLARESLEIQLGDGAELLSLDDNDSGPTPAPVTLHQTAQDSLTRTEADLRTLEAELLGLQQEKAFLLANQTLPTGTQANWSNEVQKGAALMRTRLPAIQLETNQLLKRQETLQAQAHLLQPRASETGTGTQQVLLVQATRPGPLSVVLRYYVRSRTGWQPQLDIRADAAGRELQFVSRARVLNQSGLPWQQVRLVLLRQSLGENVSRPSLSPWELSFDGGDNTGEGRIDQFVVKGTAKGRPVDVAQSSRYEVPGPVSVPAGGRRDLALPAVKLAARPEYLAIPRLSEHVFLQAKVSGWQGLQLPGQARVYHQGTYVGNTELDERAYNDSLEVALGHDEQLVVGRAKLEDLSSNAGLGGRRRVQLTYELNVRNRHSEAVRLRLVDQLPVSAEKEITVKVLDLSGAQLDAQSGKLTWLLALAPGESKRLRFSFQVEYPKDKEVEIINHQTRMSSPKTR
ncbi:MAG: DUF4139 domain-containing protein [Janthinobacterium lividum]